MRPPPCVLDTLANASRYFGWSVGVQRSRSIELLLVDVLAGQGIG
ncbi:MAG TPA: hypothetical protein VHQ98_12350 [Gaiellaceae bacterium]|nr:hypothetical protein [Gaiellaceae bacterium]